MFKIKVLTAALAGIGLAAPLWAQAQSSADLLKELQALKTRVEQLEAQVKTQQETSKNNVDPVEFNRISVKTESLEDSFEA